MTRFPDDETGAEGALPTGAEREELLALADELRAAHPEPAVGAEFGERVRAELGRPWSLRRTLDASRLARAAATLMVVTLAIAPVVALMQVLPWFRTPNTVVSVEPYLPAPEAAPAQDAELPPDAVEAPAPPDAAWIESVLRQNRLARAAATWAKAGAAAPRPAASTPPPSDWEAASAEDFWLAFLRACERGGGDPIPTGLDRRLQVLAASASAEERRLIAPWLWILRGDLLPASDLRPALAWPGAPWIAH